jgi:hypothetical protein
MSNTTVTYRGVEIEAINFGSMDGAKKDKIEQSNTYVVYDSMGRRTDIYIIASNINEACNEAKKMEEVRKLGSYYKIKRTYSGGVRG